MKKYSDKAQEIIHEAMSKYKRGELKSGQSGKRVKSREQAIAIGISEARKKGTKAPRVKRTK